MARHRVPNLGGSLRHPPDPARSPDPQIRQLVSALATLELPPAPSPHFRAELRAQLVAVAPRFIAEGDPAVGDAPAPRAGAPLAHRHRRSVRWHRPVALAVSAFAVVLVALTGLVWLSRSALPGTALYGVKRTAEGVQMSLTTGAVDKGRLYLHFATVRTNEVSDLLSQPTALGAGIQADGPMTPRTGQLVKATLASADDDVQSASQLLTEDAVKSNSTAPLEVLWHWVPTQQVRLTSIADSLPPGPLHSQAVQSASLVRKVRSRVTQVRQAVTCQCTVITHTDQLGASPTPCPDCGATSSSARPVSPAGVPSSGSSPSVVTSPAATKSSAQPPASSAPPAGSTSSSEVPVSGSSSEADSSSSSTEPSSSDSSAPPQASPVPSDSDSGEPSTVSSSVPQPTSSLPVSASNLSAPVQPAPSCDASAPSGGGAAESC